MAHPQPITQARDQTKGNTEAARTVGDEAAKVDEQLDRAAADLGRRGAETVQSGVNMAAQTFQGMTDQFTESAWKSVQSGVDAASQGVQNASDQFARTLGFTGEDSERLARQSAQNVEAITKFGSVLSQALQETSRQWYALAQRQWQRNLTGVSQLAHCRSGQDFAAAQSALVRDSLAQMVEDSRSIAEMSLRAVNEASKVIAGAAQEGAVQGRLAEKRVS
jgi:hypothetical protein